ncbi:MAG: Xaa-Pro peptidase family protein [Bacteroidetes bacterium]|nr:Xaa-Pro peptidase family protein [Bacteroidota bacterium]
MVNEIIKQKIDQAIQILNEKNIDLWLTFVRESGNIKDPALDIISGVGCTWQSALMIGKDGDTTAIVGSLDVENFERIGAYKNVKGYVQSIRELLVEYLKKKNPKRIAINFSKNSNLADGLTHGMYLILQEHLSGTDFSQRFISSEEIVSALRGRKSKAEIEIMKEAIDETLKIFDEMTKFIRHGKSEIEIANFIKDKAKEKGFGLAWEEDHCPAVFTGPEAKSAHAGPTERKVEKGHLVNVDFGIRYKGYCSDLQRTWYVLKDGETAAPKEVQKGFEVIRDSIQKVADNLKPGAIGCDMDDIARNYIIQNGYEEFPHGLGHQVGREAHDGGGGLLPRWEKYGATPFMKIEESQIYTIEPRLYVEGYGTSTIEEEVVITKSGSEFLSKPQKELILIG